MAKVCQNESGRCQKMISIVNECVYKRTGLCIGHRQPRPTIFTLWPVCSRRLRLLVPRHFLWCVFFLVYSIFDVLCGGIVRCSFAHEHKKTNKQPLLAHLIPSALVLQDAYSARNINKKNTRDEWRRMKTWSSIWFSLLILMMISLPWRRSLVLCFSFHPFIQFRHPIPSLPKLHAHVLYMHLLYPSPMFSNAMMHCNENFAGPKSTCRKLNDGHQQNKSRKKGRNAKRRFRGGLKYGPRVLWFLILLFPIPFGLLHVLLPCPLFLMLALLAILGIIHRPRMFSRFNRCTYSSITLVFLWRGRRRAVRFFSQMM